jgi:hypothetical protein
MFGDHTYLSGVTKALSAHFEKTAKKVDHLFFQEQHRKAVLDIGSNDGTQLKHFMVLGYEVLGVESSRKTAIMANVAGVPTVHAFFNEKTLDDIDKKFDVINAAGVFFHLEELHSVCRAIRRGLKADGVFVVQFLYMKSIMENLAFDQIYHEHLLYYTLKTLQVLLDRHELKLFDATLEPIHGGSIVGYVGHKDGRNPTCQLEKLIEEENRSGCNTIEAYRLFNDRIQDMRRSNLNYLNKARSDGKRVFGLGAPVKGNTMLNFFGVGPDLIECLTEINELRRDLFSPGMHIPIRMETDLDVNPDIYYVLAWNFKEEILEKNRALIESGVEFFFPVDPELSA